MSKKTAATKTSARSKRTRDRRSPCPVACALDLLGDKWSLVVVRDLLLGKSRYAEFAKSPEQIPTNILADRLLRLTDAGIVTKKAYQTNPTRFDYRLTPKGRDLGPVVKELVAWGEKHIRGSKAMLLRKS